MRMIGREGGIILNLPSRHGLNKKLRWPCVAVCSPLCETYVA